MKYKNVEHGKGREGSEKQKSDGNGRCFKFSCD